MAKGKKTGGRPTGGSNKITQELKDMIMIALSQAVEGGGIAYLKGLALNEPVAFSGLLKALIPRDINATVQHSWQKEIEEAEERLLHRKEVTLDDDGRARVLN